MRNLFLVTSLLYATSCFAQTPVPIVNPSFEGTGGWTYVEGGTWQPSPGVYTSLCNGKMIGYANSGGSIAQDLGAANTVQVNSVYTLQMCVGHRLDGYTAKATIQLFAGSTSLCSLTVDSSTIPAGTMAQETLPCPVGSTAPAGDLNILISSAGTQTDVDNVTLSYQPAVPLVTQPVTVSISATYDDGSIPTILSVAVADVTSPTTTITELSLTPNPTTGLASGSFTLSSTETYEVILYMASKQVGQTFYQGNLVLALMPQISQANFTLVLFKASGAVKSFTSGAS